jgi:hypothetical protein
MGEIVCSRPSWLNSYRGEKDEAQRKVSAMKKRRGGPEARTEALSKSALSQ